MLVKHIISEIEKTIEAREESDSERTHYFIKETLKLEKALDALYAIDDDIYIFSMPVR